MSVPTDLQRKRTHVPSCIGQSLLMVHALGAGTSGAIPQAVEDRVDPCPQRRPQDTWTPLGERGTIVNMLPLAVIAAASALAVPPELDPHHLPLLPERGFVRETKSGVELETMGGRPLGRLAGLDLAPDKTTSHGLTMRDRRGRLFVIDFFEHRVRQVFERPQRIRGCRLTDARPQLELLVCGRTVKTAFHRPSAGAPQLRVVARPPDGSPVGHWVRAEFAP